MNIIKLRNGALEISALVKIEEFSRDIWLESQVYYEYSKRDAKTEFKNYLIGKGYQLA